jgi:hypothetical protein
MNLFRRKSAIFIILSWMMLIAIAALFVLGWWGWLVFSFVVYQFCRQTLPSRASAGKVPSKGRFGTWKRPIFATVFEGLGIILLVKHLHETVAWSALTSYVWDSRDNSTIVSAIGCYIMVRIIGDLNYYSAVPNEDIDEFIGENDRLPDPLERHLISPGRSD